MESKPLRLRIIDAQGLKSPSGDTPNYYVVAKLKKGLIDSIRHKEKPFSTRIVQNTTPQWNEEFIFHPQKPETDTIILKLFNKETTKADEFMGKADISVIKYLNRGPVDELVPIKRRTGIIASPGEIHICVDYGGTPVGAPTHLAQAPQAQTLPSETATPVPTSVATAPVTATATTAAAATTGALAGAAIPALGKEREQQLLPPAQQPQLLPSAPQPQLLAQQPYAQQQPSSVPSTQTTSGLGYTEGVKSGLFGLQQVTINDRNLGATEIPVKIGTIPPPAQEEPSFRHHVHHFQEGAEAQEPSFYGGQQRPFQQGYGY